MQQEGKVWRLVTADGNVYENNPNQKKHNINHLTKANKFTQYLDIGADDPTRNFDKIIRGFLTDEQEAARFKKQIRKTERQLERRAVREKWLDEKFGSSWRSYSRAAGVAGLLLVFVALLVGWNSVLILFVYPLF